MDTWVIVLIVVAAIVLLAVLALALSKRSRLAEQEARERSHRAGEEASEAEKLRARAQKLAPDLSHDGSGQHRTDVPNPDQPGGGGATRR